MKKQRVTTLSRALMGGVLVWFGWAAFLVASTAAAQTFTLLRTFTGSGGSYPVGSLILSNATLYGMTTAGVFKMSTNGGSYSNLHSFGTAGGNANTPHAALTLSGTNLYGMTVEGGAGVGVAFRVSTNGIGYTALHYFNGRETNGSRPYGSLTLANGALYGTTSIGGTNNLGTLFRMNTSGGDYTSLHAFAGGTADGALPDGDLTLSGTVFYGMTSQGGANGLGVVFRMNTNGTAYTNLHSFAGAAHDGAYPPGSLTLEGSTLYGMAQYGGAANLGVVFKMNADGSSYTNLHAFVGGAGDGATPLGSLTLANGWLYGMTSVGGASNRGTLFRLGTDGSSYTNFHSFTGGTNDGATPYGTLMLSGSTLYGVTYYGGTNNYGVVFALSNLPEPPVTPTSLTVNYAQNRIIVSWPSTVSGWTLQTNGNLAAGAWGNYTGPMVSHTVTNSPTNGNLFFRLAR